jgi:xanthine dehydrogenase YagT iron-sulfur-binding subunit
MSESDSKVPNQPPKTKQDFSRRGFLKGVSISGGVLSTGVLETEALAASTAKVDGPGAVPITLNINGKMHKLEVEPRVTLCDALRNRLEITAAKRVCDRGTCGACTVIINGKAVYSCTTLAIDAQGKRIETLEGFSTPAHPHPLTKAFLDHDAEQCGYCTPGFVVAAKAFLDHTPNPTEADLKTGLGGNLCRCGTYMGIRKAVMQAAKEMKSAKVAKGTAHA